MTETMERQTMAGARREAEGEAAAMAVAPVAKRKGSIRTTPGPWTVQCRGRGGGLTTSLWHPTPRERENNRQCKRRRRQVAARIYAGLRANAGYALPKHADQNDVLRALCAEAGYHVDDDGNVTRHQGVDDGAAGPSCSSDHQGGADLVLRDVAVVVDVVARLGAEHVEHVVLVGMLRQRVPSIGAQAGVDPGGHLAPASLVLPIVLSLLGRRVPQ